MSSGASPPCAPLSLYPRAWRCRRPPRTGGRHRAAVRGAIQPAVKAKANASAAETPAAAVKRGVHLLRGFEPRAAFVNDDLTGRTYPIRLAWGPSDPAIQNLKVTADGLVLHRVRRRIRNRMAFRFETGGAVVQMGTPACGDHLRRPCKLPIGGSRQTAAGGNRICDFCRNRNRGNGDRRNVFRREHEHRSCLFAGAHPPWSHWSEAFLGCRRVTALAVCHHSSPRTEGRAPENQVRIGLSAGGSRIRTLGSRSGGLRFPRDLALWPARDKAPKRRPRLRPSGAQRIPSAIDANGDMAQCLGGCERTSSYRS